MWLEEIILDGFKSYAQQTRIRPLDRSFTAITGLNGSGKSNILDAICFVLGISQLSRIRVNSLTDLIYKQGQAGITKASVSLIFNNQNVKLSPQGYESSEYLTITRQILQNGTTKYLLNNQLAKQKSIKQLFMSVSMNINNPNFLIMQGRIQAILNMKPPQLLSLLEETAGTSLYDQNRKEAVKTFDSKQQRLNHIKQIIEEEIQPRIKKLEMERKISLELSGVQKAISVLEVLNEFASVQNNINLIAEHEQKQVELQQNEAILRSNLQEIEARFIVKNAEFQEKNTFVESPDKNILTIEIDKLASQIAILLQQETSQKDKIASQEKLIRRKNTELIQVTERSEKYKSELNTLLNDDKMSLMQACKAQLQQLQYQKDALESELALLRTGSVDRLYMSQFYEICGEKDVILALQEAIFTQNFITLNELQNRLQQLKICLTQETKDTKFEYENVNSRANLILSHQVQAQQNDNQLKMNLEQLEQKLVSQATILSKSLGIQLPEMSDLGSIQAFCDAVKREIQRQKERKIEEKDVIQREIQQFKKNFQTQQKTFLDACFAAGNRGGPQIYNMAGNIEMKEEIGLLGTVLELCDIDVKKASELGYSESQLLKALEISSGGKFFNLVFSSAKQAAQFVSSPQCTQRVTCLPLDNIQGRYPTQQQLQVLHSNKGALVSDFIRPKKAAFKSIFDFLFSSTAILGTLESAKNAAYNKACGLRCVTIDGDVVDPHGIVTGGSRQHSKTTYLAEFVALTRLQRPAARPESSDDAQLDKTEAFFQGFQQTFGGYKTDRNGLRDGLQEPQILLELKGLKQTLAALSETAQAQNLKLLAVDQILQILHQKTSNQAVQRDQKVIENELKTVNFGVEKCKKEVENLEKGSGMAEINRIKLQIESLSQDYEGIEKLIQQYQETLELLNQELLEHGQKLEKQRFLHQKTTGQFENLLAQEHQNGAEIQIVKQDLLKLEDEIQQKKQKFSASIQMLKELQQTLISTEKSLVENIKNIAEFTSIYAEIFGQNLTNFHKFQNKTQIPLHIFAQRLVGGNLIDDVSLAQQYIQTQISTKNVNFLLQANLEKLANLHDQQTGFSGTTANLESLQTQAKNLIQMQQKLSQDREKILSVIEKVDLKKSQALNSVFHSVDISLRNIFGILLPGADAGIEPTADGIQFSVKLGATKTTLSGLSGGQKSLLALSFTLALLRYKPSPIYILDEIDAALDLSHTHNIGKLIQQEFSGSQFVVVSLKEGMFNHANSVIRTRFQDGMSKIEISGVNGNGSGRE
ncbi:Chromosome segregation ATPase [Spironucleus salmonicida]|uniref:Structural maintenance of chromosomes protein n=1 Tax=Spironucleus salmonicida TaxID=348837 RepID=V6LPH9_9EUKA|nr:Chromosome segregation ATPase [Spironucleus salmonicida]|eukprot:EST42629.1 SMC multi domain protein [Spironucleus salmonicida]